MNENVKNPQKDYSGYFQLDEKLDGIHVSFGTWMGPCERKCKTCNINSKSCNHS